MSTTLNVPWLRAASRADALRGNWFWFVLLGIASIVLGFIALGSVVIASLATALTIGMLILGGVAETSALLVSGWSGFFLHLLSGLLSIVIGVMFLRAPWTPCWR